MADVHKRTQGAHAVILNAPGFQHAMSVLQGQLKQPRTRELVAALGRWGVNPEEHALIIVDHMFDNLHLAGRNLSNLRMNSIANLSVYDLLRADRVIVESSALAYIQEFYGKSTKAAESSEGEAESSDAEAEPSPEP